MKKLMYIFKMRMNFSKKRPLALLAQTVIKKDVPTVLGPGAGINGSNGQYFFGDLRIGAGTGFEQAYVEGLSPTFELESIRLEFQTNLLADYWFFLCSAGVGRLNQQELGGVLRVGVVTENHSYGLFPGIHPQSGLEISFVNYVGGEQISSLQCAPHIGWMISNKVLLDGFFGIGIGTTSLVAERIAIYTMGLSVRLVKS
jgi:hypothetical protein